MTDNLTAKTANGLKWTYIATGINMGLQIMLTATMARILTPDSYGLVAMCYMIVKFGAYFAQLGLASALIRQPTLTAAVINTAFCTSGIASLCLFSLVWLSAPAFEIVFGDSRIVPLVHIAAWSFLTASISVVALALLRRDMRFGTIGMIEVASFIAGPLAVGLPLALYGFGAASLVWGFLAQSIVLSMLAYTACGRSLRIRFDRSAFRLLFTFGGKHSLISFLEFLTYILDVFLIAQLLGAKALGLYNRATYLIQIPAQALNNAVTKVAYPAFSAANTDPGRLARAYLSAFLLVGMVLFPVGFGISVAAVELVTVMLGRQWADAAEILRLLAIAVPFHLMLHVHGLAFDVKAALNLKLAIRLAHLGIMASLYLALANLGLIGFAIAFTITEISFYCLYTVFVARILKIDRSAFVGCHMLVLFNAVTTALAIIAVTQLLRHTEAVPTIILVTQIATGGVMLVIQVILFPAAQFSTDLAMRLENTLGANHWAPRRRQIFKRFLVWYLKRLKQRAVAHHLRARHPSAH
ncbi:MAG: lipopolysaccharide biosynthesis protein [Alphaproteobacteria bacterium]|nr:lipopolysaccharide biosynthesis protein [Alphaproteobacteria bacterium]